MMPMDVATIVRGLQLLERGLSIRNAATTMNVAYTTLRDAIARYRQSGSLTRRPGSGRPRATSERDDRFIAGSVLRNRHITSVEVRQRLQEVRDVRVSAQTVRNRLKHMKLNARRPVRVPRLLPRHRRMRLQFARDHQQWTIDQWSKVLFTDETRVGLFTADGRRRVWRRTGERFAPCTQMTTVSFQGGSLMLWAGISFEARTDLVFIEGGRLTGARYIQEILEEHVVTFAPFVGDDFVLMHDNARPHVARCVMEYLNEVGISQMEWPALSPDMNPIEHIWDYLKRKVHDRPVAPNSLAELRSALIEEWELIPQTLIQHLIEGMYRRLQAVVAARGGNTRY